MSTTTQMLPMRVLPHSEEAEQGLLGSILAAPGQTMELCVDKVQPHHFYSSQHQQIYAALTGMFQLRKTIDIITFSQFMEDDGTLETVGGRQYITSLFTFVPTAANAAYYLDIVRRKWIRRDIIAQCTELVRQAFEENEEEHELLDAAQAKLTAMLMESDRTESVRHVREGISASLEALEQAYKHRGNEAVTGFATGIHDLDRMTSGFQKQNLIIIAARPSQGKTALALNIGAHMAINGVSCRSCSGRGHNADTKCNVCAGTGKNQVPVAVFSMEMTFQEIANRLLSCFAGVSVQRFRDGFLSRHDFEDLPTRAGEIAGAPLWIDDAPALSIASLRARARRLRTRHEIGAIVVDYLQLMRGTSKRSQDNPVQEIREISGGLKAIAKELDIPVICLSQLNREAEHREFGKPKLSDLREGGSIEQDADVALLLWRPERHIETYSAREKLAKKLKLKDDDGSELFGDAMTDDQRKERDRQINEYAELIVAKQRNGPVGDIRLRFISDLTKFENVTTKVWSNNPKERQKATP